MDAAHTAGGEGCRNAVDVRNTGKQRDRARNLGGEQSRGINRGDGSVVGTPVKGTDGGGNVYSIAERGGAQLQGLSDRLADTGRRGDDNAIDLLVDIHGSGG